MVELKEKNIILDNLSSADYHKLKIISKSKLDDLERSPEYFKHQWDSEEEKTTSAMDFGSLFHCLLLTPEEFENEFAVEPVVNKRTNEGKAILEEFYENNKNKIVVMEKDIEAANTLVAEINRHPIASKLLNEKGKRELSMFWEDENGVQCKGRIDLLTDNNIIVDFKTTTDAKPENFERRAYDYGYHKQAYFYSNGFEKLTGKKPKAFIFVAIEKTAPFSVCVFAASEELLQIGKIEIDKLMNTYTKCLQTNNWYGYNGENPTIVPLNPPYYVENRYREEIENV